LLVEVNKEFDGNASHSHPAYEDPQLKGYGITGNFGQPSVVYRVPIHIDSAAGVATSAAVSQIDGYSSWTGEDGAIIPRDATISTANPGSGEARLLERIATTGPGRVARRHRAVRFDHLRAAAAAARPGDRPCRRSQRARRHLGRVLTFAHAQANGGAVSSYEIRYREGATMSDQEFVEAVRAPLVVPGAPGTTASGHHRRAQTRHGLHGGGARDGRLRTDLDHRDAGLPDARDAVQAGRGLLRRNRCLGVRDGLAGRRASAGPRPSPASERDGRNGDRSLLPVRAPCGRAASPQRDRAGCGENVTFAGCNGRGGVFPLECGPHVEGAQRTFGYRRRRRHVGGG
jgi:hypothetical protein